MKNSDRNLMVLRNFILFLTHCEKNDHDAEVKLYYTANELYEMVENYIEEDHVDGKGNEND